ncbi:MAG: NAD(P)/FAD-dependent oxidoreductase [Methylococcales bacterium]|nr:NAD(P)/FAD-dependent oxidoreductase [Methylococcales bacterium]
MTTDKKTAIIIGAGISGLATGCYLQMNGYQTRIFEMHDLPGGCCTTWDIKDYRCDYCIGWMAGCGDESEKFTQIWRELGALQNQKIQHFDLFNSVVCDEGTRVNFYVDPDRLQQHLLAISPIDEKPIAEFCAALKKFMKFVDVYAYMVLKPDGLLSLLEKIQQTWKLLPFIKLFMRTGGTKMADFADEFQSPVIRQAMKYILYLSHDTLPMLPFITNIAFSGRKVAGCPEIGSLGISELIAQRYQELGGEIVYEQKISKILVTDNQAVGISNSNNEFFHADHIVSTMDGYQTLKHLLDDRYTSPVFEALYEKAVNDPEGIVFEGIMSMFIGVDIDLSDEIHCTTYFFNDEEVAALPGIIDNSFSIQVRSNMFKGLAPKGKSLVFMTCLCDYKFWENLDRIDNDPKSLKTHVARKRSRAYKDAKKKSRGDFYPTV